MYLISCIVGKLVAVFLANAHAAQVHTIAICSSCNELLKQSFGGLYSLKKVVVDFRGSENLFIYSSFADYKR